MTFNSAQQRKIAGNLECERVKLAGGNATRSVARKAPKRYHENHVSNDSHQNRVACCLKLTFKLKPALQVERSNCYIFAKKGRFKKRTSRPCQEPRVFTNPKVRELG